MKNKWVNINLCIMPNKIEMFVEGKKIKSNKKNGNLYLKLDGKITIPILKHIYKFYIERDKNER